MSSCSDEIINYHTMTFLYNLIGLTLRFDKLFKFIHPLGRDPLTPPKPFAPSSS